MARSMEGRQKSQTLTIRLDEKTRFILEFMARINGQTMTTIVERAIMAAAESTVAGEPACFGSGYGQIVMPRNWKYYWNPNEGIRTIKLLSDSPVYTTFEEDELIEFIRDHWEFFSVDAGFSDLVSAFINVLWPDIQEYLEHWRSNKTTDRWATGSIMLSKIKHAGMEGPNWPRSVNLPQPPAPPPLQDDDEISF